MKTIINNLAVEYQEGGIGPVMLLLHGWKQTLHTFDALIPEFAASWRVVRLDLPGFGGSQPPKEPWGVSEYTVFVKHFCEKLQIKPEILIGHSFGGRIAIKGVGEKILQPKKVVLLASAGLAKHKTLRNQLFAATAKVGKVALFLFPLSVQERFRRKLYKEAGSDYLDAGALRETFLKITREDLSDLARKITVPTLLIWGENDTAIPLSDGKRLAQLISGSKLKVISGAGHFVHQEKPREVAKLIREFLLS